MTSDGIYTNNKQCSTPLMEIFFTFRIKKNPHLSCISFNGFGDPPGCGYTVSPPPRKGTQLIERDLNPHGALPNALDLVFYMHKITFISVSRGHRHKLPDSVRSIAVN